MARILKLAWIGENCVACGCCVAACPRKAIHIHLGVSAQVDSTRCVGCGRCATACPAAIITLGEREG